VTQLTEESLQILRDLIEDKEKVNAKIVVKSKKSGKDVTYKISGFPDEKKKFYTDYKILIGFENDYNSFTNCCYVTSIGSVEEYSRYRFTHKPIIKGAHWLLEHFINRDFDHILDKAELYHTGRCLKCGRELTDAHSIELGIGPVCRGNKH